MFLLLILFADIQLHKGAYHYEEGADPLQGREVMLEFNVGKYNWEQFARGCDHCEQVAVE